jgi:DNA polymerase-1
LRSCDFEIARLLLRTVSRQDPPTYATRFHCSCARERRITSFHRAIATTGIFSSNPNLQNIPIRTPLGRRVREAFVARDPGWRLLSADYSQIELRIMAELSGDAALREAFRNGEDVHRRTAAEIARKAPGEVTPEERDAAKVVNYGVMYGMSAYGLARQLRIDAAEAAAFIQAYYARHPGVSRYLARVLEEEGEGHVTTLLARRYLPPRAENPRERAEASARHQHSHQGTAADRIKVAMAESIARSTRAGSPRAWSSSARRVCLDAPVAEIDRP